jgi:hypothetical protein
MHALVAVILVLGLTGTASAQTVAVCKKIGNDTARLACFDSLPGGEDGSFGPQIRPQASAPGPADASFTTAEKAIRRNLNDPETARFIGLQRRSDAVCGFVNAKNPSGGYTGSKLFVHVLSTGETHVLDQPEDSLAGQPAQAAYASHCK